MEAVKWLAILLGSYGVLVIVFECFVVFMGMRQAASGVGAGEDWVILTTTDPSGSTNAVVAGVESGGQLYVAANHWPRRWYRRVIENPDLEVTRAGETNAYRAIPVIGEERVQIARDYHLPWIVRLLTGFPPRSFLRLQPR